MYIKIDLKIILLSFIYIITNRIKNYAFIILFALIHELGHLLCGIILKMKPKSMYIAPYGFELDFKINYKDYNKRIKKGNMACMKRIIIALAGPWTNAILSLIFLRINKEITYSNLIIFILNIVPIYPLDGGRIVKDIAHIFNGKRQSFKLEKRITMISIVILTLILGVIAFMYKNFLILVTLCYLWSIALKNKKEIELKEKIYSKIIEKTCKKSAYML